MEDLKIDIEHLSRAIEHLKNAQIALTDVEDVTDEDYEKLCNITEIFVDLKMEKEIELERMEKE